MPDRFTGPTPLRQSCGSRLPVSVLRLEEGSLDLSESQLI